MSTQHQNIEPAKKKGKADYDLEAVDRMRTRIHDIMRSAERNQLPYKTLWERINEVAFGTAKFKKFPVYLQHGLWEYQRGVFHEWEKYHVEMAYYIEGRVVFIHELTDEDRAYLGPLSCKRCQEIIGTFYKVSRKPFQYDGEFVAPSIGL